MATTATASTDASARASGRALVGEWVALGGLVVVSAAVRFALARTLDSPWIFVDELVYSELAKGLADHGEPLLRGVPVGNRYGVLYPLLLSPAYALREAMPDVYTAVRAINA